MLCKITDPNCTSEYNGDVELPELGKWYSWEEVMTLAAFNVSISGYGFVYVYYDMVNKKYYVGVCKQAVRKRSRQHHNKTGKLSRIDSIIKDIGCNRILVCIVKVCRIEDLAYFENYFMGILNTLHPNGYNSKKSGYVYRDSCLTQVLMDELPKERLIELQDKGYTYTQIASLLSVKMTPESISIYGRSLGIKLKKRTDRPDLVANEIAELTSAGYSDSEIGDSLDLNSRTVAGIRRKNNIPSGKPKTDGRPVLKIDVTSGVMLARYSSVCAAARTDGIPRTTLCTRIKRKTIKNGAYLIYEDEYLDQQRSSTQVAEGA